MEVSTVSSGVSAYNSQTLKSAEARQTQQVEQRESRPREQVEKKEEAPKPVKNAQGQVTGSLINVTA